MLVLHYSQIQQQRLSLRVKLRDGAEANWSEIPHYIRNKLRNLALFNKIATVEATSQRQFAQVQNVFSLDLVIYKIQLELNKAVESFYSNKKSLSKTTFTVIPACLESFRLVRNRKERCWTSQHDKIVVGI